MNDGLINWVYELQSILQSQLATLSIHRNSLTPVGRLSDDIIIMIMRCVAQKCHEGDYTLDSPLLYLNRHFRRIALTTPSVYSTIKATGPSEARLVLERSQGSLLDFLGPSVLWPLITPELPLQTYNSWMS